MNIAGRDASRSSTASIRAGPGTRARLLLAAEQIKRHLSDNGEARGELKNLGVDAHGQPICAALRDHPRDVRVRDRAAGRRARVRHLRARCWRRRELTASQIDEVILVGGSTRMPLVRPRCSATSAGRRAPTSTPTRWWPGARPSRPRSWPTPARTLTSQAVLLDVTPRALGIAVAGGYAEKIVDKNVPGAGRADARLRHLGRQPDHGAHPGLPGRVAPLRRERRPRRAGAAGPAAPRRRGEVKIEVTFRVDTNGILRVRARDAGHRHGLRGGGQRARHHERAGGRGGGRPQVEAERSSTTPKSSPKARSRRRRHGDRRRPPPAACCAFAEQVLPGAASATRTTSCCSVAPSADTADHPRPRTTRSPRSCTPTATTSLADAGHARAARDHLRPHHRGLPGARRRREARAAYDAGLAAGKMPSTPASARRRPAEPRGRLTHPEAKKFFRLGMVCLGEKDWKGAVMNFNFAKTFEPGRAGHRREAGRGAGRAQAKGGGAR